MKKVLIILPSYSIGGTTLSLFALLSKIDPKCIQVDVLAKPVGYYKGKMPNCKELKENFWISYPLVGKGRVLKLLQQLVYGLRYILSKMHINLFPLIYRLGGKALNTMQYDAIVSYSEGMAYINSFIPAKKRIAWIHCDYRNHYAINNSYKEEFAYARYDTIVAVSEFARETFLGLFPQYSNKTKVIYNCIDEIGISQKSKDETGLDPRFNNDCFTIVSVGRLDPIKQFNLIPSIAKEIKQITNKPFHWYIIGGGADEWIDIIKREIVGKGVEYIVIMLGEQPNVYPYISKSSLLVHTSKSESFSLVVKEAKALCVPSIVNDYECATEFIKDGIDGMIVPVHEMGKRIVQFIESPTLLGSIISKLQLENQKHEEGVVEQFFDIL